MFPYKFKIKISACPNDCVASIARSDFSVIGTWKGDIRIDQAEVEAYAASASTSRRRSATSARRSAWNGTERN